MSCESPLRFDGRVAIVTGAAGALGRAYAMLLSSRGAKVLVNDFGTTREGQNGKSTAADEVVSAIQAEGGEAVANYDSVENGELIVEDAIRSFGRVDIVINNAGFLMDQSFHKMAAESWDAIQAVHLRGAFKVTRAAWSHMRKQKYGRVVMTSSASGVYGNFGQANYAAAKLALVGLSNTLAMEGAKFNVFVNSIVPFARSRMTEGIFPPNLLQHLDADYIAPVVAYLCHSCCSENGGLFELGAGFVAKLRWQRANGACLPMRDASCSLEEVARNWSQAVDFREGATYPSSLQESVSGFFDHVRVHRPSVSSSTPSSQFTGFKCEEVVTRIESVMARHSALLVPAIQSIGVYRVTAGPNGRHASFTIDLKNGDGKFSYGEGNGSADFIFKLSDGDFMKLMSKETTAQELYRNGSIDISGNISAAITFEMVLSKASKL